jgi:hypothetical protein
VSMRVAGGAGLMSKMRVGALWHAQSARAAIHTTALPDLGFVIYLVSFFWPLAPDQRLGMPVKVIGERFD